MVVQLIKKLARKNKVTFKNHAFIRMFQRNISSDDVVKALSQGEIIEEYPTDIPLPSYLVLGYTSQKRPLHVVVAVDEGQKMLWVITAYEPDREIWNNDFKKRRKP